MIGHLLTAFALVFLAELPDKTMFATLFLTTRYKRPGAVWAGAASAFAVHATLAVVAGSLLRRLPHRPLEVAVAAVFLIGGTVMLRGGAEETHAAHAGAEPAITYGARAVALRSASVVGLAELGDLTQIAMAGLATRFGDPVAVGIGGWLGLVAVAGIAATAGRVIERRVPLRQVQRVAGALFIVFAAVSLWSAAR